jgi:predicted  nucleic acid-binding Zn-ribbon protein
MANVKEFSVEEKLTSLVTLQKIESKLDEIQILKGERPMEVADLEDEIQGLHSRQTRIEEEINGVTDFIEMQQLEVKLAEKHIKDATEEIAEKAVLLDKAKKNIGNKESLLANKKTELEKIIAANEKEEKHFAKLAMEAREHVDNRLLASYDKIRKSYRNGLAVVPVERDACGGCFYSIPPQKQSEIKQHKKVMVCENCGRILVDEELSNNVEVK